MAGHYPFGAKRGSRYGLAPRGTLTAFFEKEGLNKDLQEEYYKFWYDFAKGFVENDADLSATVGVRFSDYPMGTHAHKSFHLNDKQWAMCMDELGSFISNLIFTKMDDDAKHKLEDEHKALLDGMRSKSDAIGEIDSVGLFRHV